MQIIYTISHCHVGSSLGGGCYTSVVSSTPKYGTHKEYVFPGAINAYSCQHCGCAMRYVDESTYQWVIKATEKETCTKNVVGTTYTYGLSCNKTEGETWQSNTTDNLEIGDTVYSATIIY